KWASSFVGFAPLDDPQLVLFVMVDEPSGTHFGSAVAGPIWREVMEKSLAYLNVPPAAGAIAAMQQRGDSGGEARAGDGDGHPSSSPNEPETVADLEEP